jgi:hypothetical protein
VRALDAILAEAFARKDLSYQADELYGMYLAARKEPRALRPAKEEPGALLPAKEAAPVPVLPAAEPPAPMVSAVLRPGVPRPVLLGCAALLLVVVALVAWTLANRDQSSGPGGPAASDNQPPGPPPEIRMHEVWASSAENTWHRVRTGRWVMTDFPVTQPYLRSVEVAAADVDEVQLIVYDEHGQEIAAGEAPIVDYRAKYIFEKPVDIHDYIGKRLFLQARNISRTPMRVYFTKNDRDRSVTSYLWCPAPKATDCPNPRAEDLSVLIIGWSRAS